MKALANKKDFLNKVTRWVVSFTLVFSMMGTPAFASELETDEAQTAPVEAVVTPVASVEEAPAAAVVETEAPAEAIVIEPEAEEVESDLAETTVPAPVAETVTEGSGITTNSDVYVQDDLPKLNELCSVAITGVASNGAITYAVVVTNTSSETLTGLNLELLFDLSIVNPSDTIAAPEPFTLEAGDHRTFTFELSTEGWLEDSAKAYASVSGDSYDNIDIPNAECETSVVSEVVVPSLEDFEYEYKGYAELYRNNSEVEDGIARPGDTIKYMFYISNGPNSDDMNNVVVSNYIGLDSVEPLEFEVISAGDDVEIVGTYFVTADDVVLEGSNFLSASIEVTIDGSEPLVIEAAGFEVAPAADVLRPYSIRYLVEGEQIAFVEEGKGKAALGQPYKPTEEELTAHLNDYANCVLPDETPYIKEITDTDNVLVVNYSRALIPYTIKYYKDDKSKAPIAEKELFGKATSWVTAGDYLNSYVPKGYAELTQDTDPILLASATEENVIDVVYAQKNKYAYTVNFYGVEQDSDELKLIATDKHDEGAAYGDKVSLPVQYVNSVCGNLYEPLSWEGESPYSCTITDDPAENVIDVVYDQAKVYTSTINIYQEVANKDPELVTTIIRSGNYGDEFNIEAAQLNEYKTAAFYKNVSQGISFTFGEAEPEYNVTFELNTYNYSVAVYRNQYVGLSLSSALITNISGEAKYGSMVTVPASDINVYKPEVGYVDYSRDLTFEVGMGTNTHSATFELAKYGYTINFYVEDASGEPFKTLTDESLYGSTVNLTNLTLNGLNNSTVPAGYMPIEGTKQLVISDDPSQNVVDVIFDQKRTDIPYTINYYAGSVASDNLVGSDVFEGTLGAQITNYELGKYLPEGYAPNAQVTGDREITAKGSVLNVVYDEPHNFSYTVNYYNNSVKPENWLGSTQSEAPYGSAIPYTPGAHLPSNLEYDDYAISGTELVGIDPSQNVLNVIYTTQQVVVPQATYTIRYYAGSSYINTISGVGNVGDVIPVDENAFIAQAQGYTTPAQVSGATIISNDAEENVVTVVYPLGTFGYTVNYYQDSVSVDNLLSSTSGTAAYSSAIPYTMGYAVPTGYNAQGSVIGTTTVGYNAANNVLNIVYQPARFGFTIYYYHDSIDPQNLITSDPQDARLFGSTATVSAAQMNLHRPDGYQALTADRSVYISENAANNVINVVFEPEPVVVDPTPVVPVDPTPTEPVVTVPNNPAPSGDSVQTPATTNPSTDNNNTSTNTNGEDFEVIPGILDEVADQVGSAVAALDVAPAATEAAAPARAVTDATEPTDADTVEEATTIEDDVNPLASGVSKNTSNSSKGFALIDYLLLILGTLCAAAALVFLNKRRSLVKKNASISGEALAVGLSKASTYSRRSICLGIGAVALYAVWIILRLLS